MKKHIILALILALAALVAFTLTACGNNDTPDTPDTTDNQDTTDNSTDETPATTKPTGDTFYGYTTLTLAKDPVVDSEGRLVLYFNESILCTDTTKASIGMKAPGAAESVNATADINAYPDMKTEAGCFGIALVPEYELSKGKYTFSITIENMYIVEFEYTVK